jgi:hypothetical protein
MEDEMKYEQIFNDLQFSEQDLQKIRDAIDLTMKNALKEVEELEGTNH